MLDDISDIQSYYDKAADRELVRLERHQLERDITWLYLDKYLPSKGSILEIGASTGGYTLELARRGYSVTATDISGKLLEINKKRISEVGLEQKVTYFVADARNLKDIGQDTFDTVLLMGPLYHLVYEEDRKTVVKEAFNRLKPGGVIFSAFISRYGIWGDVIKNLPHYIEFQADLHSVMEKGKDADPPNESLGFRGYFARASEIAPLHEEVGFETLVVAGVEPCISADDESYNRLEGERREMWLDLFYELSTEESIIAASRHLLYIGLKPQ